MIVWQNKLECLVPRITFEKMVLTDVDWAAELFWYIAVDKHSSLIFQIVIGIEKMFFI